MSIATDLAYLVGPSAILDPSKPNQDDGATLSLQKILAVMRGIFAAGPGGGVGANVNVTNFPATQVVSVSNFPAGSAVNLTQVAGSAIAIGQAAMAASLPVVLASNQSAIPVTGTFFQATQPVSGTFFQATQPVSGTVTTTPPANASTNLAQYGGVTVAQPSVDVSFGTLTNHKSKNAAGSVISCQFTSADTTLRWFQLFDTTSALSSGVTVPKYSFALPPGSATSPVILAFGTDFFGQVGTAFATGITWGLSSTMAVWTSTSVTVGNHTVHVQYT